MTNEPDILRVIREQRAALLRGDTATLARYASQWRVVEQTLADNIELLAREVADLKATGAYISQSRLWQLERYSTLLRQTQNVIREFGSELSVDIEQRQLDLWRLGQVAGNQQIAALLPSFAALPIEATNTFIGFSGDGTPLRNLLQTTWPNAADAMTQSLLTGVAQGRNPRVVARDMRQATQASLNQMLTIARTEQMRAYREGSRAIYQQSGIVQQYRRVATRSRRTCMHCIARDGELTDVAEPMPLHPSCRCTTIPVLTGLQLDYGEPVQDWFARQSADVQRDVLGKARFDLYRNGTPLSAFTRVRQDVTWGPTLEAPTLAEIGV